jgi:hypothetical protein
LIYAFAPESISKNRVCRDPEKPSNLDFFWAKTDAGEMIYLEFISGSVCQFPSPVSGFKGKL